MKIFDDHDLESTHHIGDIKYVFDSYSGYEVVEHNNSYYVVGISPMEQRAETISDSHILLSAIELGDIFADAGYFNFYSRLINNVDIPDLSRFPEKMQNEIIEYYKLNFDQILPLIIDWCRTLGMPLLEDDIHDDDSLYFSKQRIGFKIDQFIFRLGMLHTCFYKWRYAEFGEQSRWNIALNTKSNEWFTGPYMSSGLKYEITFNANKGGYGFHWFTTNIFDLLDIQLALLTFRMNPDGSHIKQCAKCMDFFEAVHGNKKYCGKPGCNAGTVAHYKWAKKKEREKV